MNSLSRQLKLPYKLSIDETLLVIRTPCVDVQITKNPNPVFFLGIFGPFQH